ncbi:5-oxoprolinase subunit B/C family protein [Intrasporangium oryzae]|uniref:5-oxoprolinase subunit B/C family protein n=1 Tax=Intrasporangium oryzae TaxID=412687 RepID=UPI0004B23A24|nr:5-oxoprolinase/urea amidolyase family protein [Intrasporangium oryzae]
MASRPDEPVRVLPAGDRALVVEVRGIRESLALHARLRPLVDARDGVGASVEHLVVAARTLLVVTRAEADLGRVADGVNRLADDLDAEVRELPVGEVVEIPVHYDGPDLDEVAAHTGLTTREVVEAHTGSTWRVGFGGFAPGFAYLFGGHPALHVPRRTDPRTRVPAGSVALAGEFSGVYPHPSPGGWQLIGTTDLAVWDVRRDPPALLVPGAVVRFVERARPRDTAHLSTEPPRPRPEPAPRRALEVLATGPLTLIEDLGRPGLGDVGVGRSGVADRAAYALGARLVGQDAGPAALEVTLGGLALRAHGDALVALTGAACPATVDGRAVPHAAPFHLDDGQVLRLGMPPSGLRTYVSVRGGIDAPPVLGSRSTDTLSGLGPAPLAVGQVLPVGPAPRTFPTAEVAPQPPAASDVLVLDVLPGPRTEWFADPGTLAEHDWVVSGRSNRVGLRLEGTPVERHTAWRDRQLPSEGLVRGALQVPPSGEPVLFLADHPVTGGYPVIGVVRDAAVDRAAQLRPGDRLRLRWA